jgi:hypothetical protein
VATSVRSLIGLARGQRVFARHTPVCQTVVARWLGCRQLPFAGLRANSRSRPFSVTQLRIRNGSSCPLTVNDGRTLKHPGGWKAAIQRAAPTHREQSPLCEAA